MGKIVAKNLQVYWSTFPYQIWTWLCFLKPSFKEKRIYWKYTRAIAKSMTVSCWGRQQVCNKKRKIRRKCGSYQYRGKHLTDKYPEKSTHLYLHDFYPATVVIVGVYYKQKNPSMVWFPKNIYIWAFKSVGYTM